jgi:hypothetical protein
VKQLLIASLLLTPLLVIRASAQVRHIDLEANGASRTRTAPDPVKEASKLALILAASEASLEGRVVVVNATENRFIVEELKSKKRFNIPLNAKTELKADKGTELAGRKKLAITDFKPGQLIKVVYTIGPKVVEVRLRREKSGTTLNPPPTINEKEPRSGQPIKPPL